MSILEDLIQLGFRPITDWVVKGNKIGPRSFRWPDHSGWLYAFVVEREVKYIGLTTRVLRSRISDYSHVTESQSTRLRGLIQSELRAGRNVGIFGLTEPAPTRLVAEELRLRALYRPPWNRT